MPCHTVQEGETVEFCGKTFSDGFDQLLRMDHMHLEGNQANTLKETEKQVGKKEK